MKNTARNASSMKLGNMLDIMNIVRQNQVSRADLARMTGLSRAAVTIIVDKLKAEGILFERAQEKPKQKKPVLLGIRENSSYFMGVDITRTGCSIGILDLAGNMISETGFEFQPDDSFDQIIPSLRSGMRSAYEALTRPGRLRGIGISVPGPVDVHTGMVLNPPKFPMLRGQNVKEGLDGVIDAGIWLDNNAAARALYEKNLGQGRQFRDFMVMIVDTGIGSGMILDGKLYRGTGYAGEAGHVSVDMNGENCACGNRGCLELYASIPALISGEFIKRPGIRSWGDIVDMAEAGDAHCLTAIDKEARYLAQGIVNMVNLLDLEAVILTGFITYKPALLLDRIRRLVNETCMTGAIHTLEILAASPGQDKGTAGAAMIAMEKFFTGQSGWKPPD